MVSSNPGLFKAWLLALRPKTLSAAAAPVLVGASLVAFHPNFDRVACALAFLGAFLLQILSNFVNDLYDYLKGTDNADRIGPARTVQSGWISPSAMKTGIAVVILLNVLLGSALVWISGWPILVLGISAILSAIAYTAGPFPLGYRGLGEVFVILYFGFAAVCGTCYVCVGSIPDAAWPLAFAIGVLSSAILVVNNLRDEEGDRLSKKRTLVVRFGHRFGIEPKTLGQCDCLGTRYQVDPSHQIVDKLGAHRIAMSVANQESLVGHRFENIRNALERRGDGGQHHAHRSGLGACRTA